MASLWTGSGLLADTDTFALIDPGVEQPDDPDGTESAVTGDEMPPDGSMVALSLDTDGTYTVAVELADGPLPARVWAVQAGEDGLALTTMGGRQSIPVPQGWYAVTARASYAAADDPDDYRLDVLLTPTPSRPETTAPLDPRLAPDGSRRTPGVVSVWTGTGFASEAELAGYVEFAYPDDGPAASAFCDETGLEWYDDDLCEIAFSAAGELASVVPDHSGSESFEDAVVEDLAGRGDATALVLVYDLDASTLPERPATGAVRFLGSYPYRGLF